MTKKIPLLLLYLFFAHNTFSQEQRAIFSGKLIDSFGAVKDANIINLKTNQGTSSSDTGDFSIFVKKGDSLRISSIQHITKIIAINEINSAKTVIISLVSSIYQLDEFELKTHNLRGILGIDTKSIPVNKRDSLLKKTMDFSDVNMNIVEKNDYIDERVRPHQVRTDPNTAFVGVGASVNMPFKYSERLWALRKKLAIKKAFPYKILSELGEKFFFEKLKIPIENYFHFLEYCNPLGIENLHQQGKLLELIKILTKESTEYLKIIKNE
ncbi:MAG: hypothetical protein ACPG44_05420 [Polaribacter sp.]